MTHKETLCWSCKRVGTGTCSWDKRLKPVDGWKAKQRPYPGKMGRCFSSIRHYKRKLDRAQKE